MHKTTVTAIAALLLAGSATAALAKSDTAFMKDAIQGDLSEMMLGTLAAKKGASEDVRNYGKTLNADHSAAHQQAAALARKMGIVPPSKPMPVATKEYKKLSGMSGRAFDKEFVSYMIKDHKEDIAEFQEQAKGSDKVAALAKQTLPTLEKHLHIAEHLAGSKSAER